MALSSSALNQMGYYDAQRDQYIDEQRYRNLMMQEQLAHMAQYQQRATQRIDQQANQTQIADISKPKLLLLLED